jgi:putative two-component system response regulator
MKIPGKILIIDDSEIALKLLSTILEHENYEIRIAKDAFQAFEVLTKFKPDIILLDIMMPKMDGYEFAKRIKDLDDLKNIPIILVTALNDQESKIKGLNAGAEEFISKPIDRTELLIRTKNLIKMKKYHDEVSNLNKSLEDTIQKRTEQLNYSYIEAIISLSRIIDSIYEGNSDISTKLSRCSTLLANQLNCRENFISTLRYARTIYDIGKTKIPYELLHKKTPLTEADWILIKNHSESGSNILKALSSPYLNIGSTISLYHHENFDGTGYPHAIKELEIPVEARIIKLCDIYLALRCNRPYREPYSHEASVNIIIKGDSKTKPEHFDPNILETFKNQHNKFNEIFEEIS